MTIAEEPLSSTPVPSPHDVAARFVLGRVSARTPWWAAQWLASGHDGEALRETAGLNGRDTRALDDLLPAVLAEIRGSA